MKKLMILAAMVLMLSGAIPAQAESTGSAVIPTMLIQYSNSGSYRYVNIGLSSITDEEISCTITVFDHDGTDITSTALSKVGAGVYNSDTTLTIGTNQTFNMPGNGSRQVQLYIDTPCSVWAHAVIKWTSTDKKTMKALVGTVNSRLIYNGNIAIDSSPINNGQPF